MDNRRLLLAFLLSMAVLLGWRALFPPPEPPPLAPAEEVAAPALAESAPGAPPVAREAPAEEAPEVGPAPEVEGVAPAELEEPIEASAEERIVLESERIRVELTNRGARLVSFRLKEHPREEGIVDLIRQRAEAPYPLAITGPGGEPSPLDDVLWEVERWRDSADREVVTFRYRGVAGSAEKTLSFGDDGLFEIDVRRQGPGGWGLLLGPGVRNPSLDELENRFARRSAVYWLGGELERVDPQSVTEPSLVGGGGLGFVGLQDTYFLTSFIPGEGLREVLLKPQLVWPAPGGGPAAFADLPSDGELTDEQEELGREMAVVLRAGTDRLTGLAYFGAKEYDRLAAMPYGLENTVELGWFKFLSLPLLWGVRWIHENVVSNYGWAIILMTVLIRLLLFPLTHKSTVSMQKMQELNPKIQAIRQKYRPKLKDKQGRPNPEMQRKMNEEVMGVYKAEGVNPAGGCLPMLLQIPVLFAFYNLLSTAIELRYAPWLLWIRDLSAPDPYYVLPIVMGGSQFLQQRLTPATGDPMQRRIFMLMPIFFTVLFLGFPSGLVLYWLTNNVLGIAQQAIYMKIKQAKEEAEGGKSPASKKKKKKKGA